MKKSGKITILILIIFVIVGIGITIGYTFTNKYSNNNEYMPFPDIEYQVSKVTCGSSVGKAGDKIQCSAYDSNNVQISNSLLIWSSEGLATVDGNGLVTIKESDTPFPDSILINITARSGNSSASYAITWGGNKIDVTSIELNISEKTLVVDEQFTLTPTLLPNDATNKTVTWQSSNSSVATVNNGTVTAISGGVATITATTSNGKTATCNVIVNVPVTGINLFTTQETLAVGEKFSFAFAILPNDATNKTVTWQSSNSSVATVNNGTVTAISGGVTTITATTSNGKTATCQITVIVPVTNISLSKSSVTLEEEKFIYIIPTISPTNATDKTVSWSSSNTSVAIVDSNGKVTALKEGTASITATTSNGKTAICNITVVVPVTNISLSKSSVTLEEEKFIYIIPTVLPTNATDKTVSWSSSNTSIATVDSNGKVTALKAGIAYITAATSNGKTAICKVTVETAVSSTISVTGLTLDKTNLSLKVGTSSKLNVTINPINATNKNVYWSSSDNNIVSVDQNGNIKAIKAGKATITVNSTSDTTKTATCTIEVTDEEIEETNISVTGITLKDSKLTMNINDKYHLTTTITPSNATDQNVTWESSDESVVTVSENGVINAKKEGNAIITVTTVDGSKKATCQITVTNNKTDVVLSNINTLSLLVLSEGKLDFFSPEIENYNVVVPSNVDSISIYSTLTDAKSKYVEGYGNRTVDLNNTDTEILIKVKAENGDIKTYTINITREFEASAIISNITINNYEIDFNSSILEYNIKIKDEKKLDFNIELAKEEYSYDIIGNSDLTNGSVIIVKGNGNNKTIEYKFNISTSNIDVPITSLDSPVALLIGSIILGIIGLGIICFVIKNKFVKKIAIDKF